MKYIVTLFLLFTLTACQTPSTNTAGEWVDDQPEEHSFELGDDAPAPWGGEMFCEEYPEECGL